ncbi:MAG: type IIA DNA topoisomerase subunit B [Planctomycetota bacterium]
MSVAKKAYTAADIDVLEGLEPVRKRPAMYIGGVGKDGYHHLLAEVVDNSVDEAMNGHGSTIEVILSADRRTLTVIDDGRGIPVDPHPRAKLPAVTVILTTLHAGGKFSNKNYARAGGLHGVGSSVVNALSESLEVEVWRDGHAWKQRFERGVPVGKLVKGEKTDKTGTRITFTPDPQIFGERMRFDAQKIHEDLDNRSFVHKGVRFFFQDEATGQREKFLQNQGIAALLGRAIKLQHLTPSIPDQFLLERDAAGPEEPIARVEVVLTWTDAQDERIRGYVNGVVTPQGGTHIAGLKGAVVKAVKSYIATHKKALPKGLKLTPDDIREGLIAVLSIFIAEPQFQGQTKSRLNNPEATAGVEAAVWPALEQWFNTHTSLADQVLERISTAARARQVSRAAAQAVRTKGRKARKAALPDKLADCASKVPEECELFIVEGDSAGGSAKMGRDVKTQAVLPLRGKVLNAEREPLKKVLENRELSDILKALGCGLGESFELEKLNYGKVILLMDADADGDHITTLLLTFFYRYLPQLIRTGKLFVARPPLFKVELGKKEVHWAVNEEDLERILAKARKDRKPVISRFKGLGEMNDTTLYETTMDPKNRVLHQVEVGDVFEAEGAIQTLMGKDPAPRFEFIMEGAPSLREVDV